MLRIDPATLSPDPTRIRRGSPAEGNRTVLELFPDELLEARPAATALRAWGRTLDMYAAPPALTLAWAECGVVDLSLDFGTELEAELVLDITVKQPCFVCVLFGESPHEITGVALPTIVPHVPLPTEHRRITRAGRQKIVFDARGFRFARIVFPDLYGTLTIHRVSARAFFACRAQEGDFSCDAPAFQRVWQAALYTARLCTRSDAYWDGIKRDRVGWYGDARITQLTMDSAFSDPRPAVQMLLSMPVDSWANSIPGYSFDGIAMFLQVILRYGVVPESADIFARVRRMMDWAARTHMNRDGLFTRSEHAQYFMNYGFVDWSTMPLGGRFEEVAWVQCKWLEALRNAARVAALLGRNADAEKWLTMAGVLAPKLVKKFFRTGKGFIHTLNMSARAWEKPELGRQYQTTYIDKTKLGESGPSRQSSALAAFAGLCDEPVAARAVLKALNNNSIEPVITGYFAWYEQCARAICGDVPGAMMNMLGYFGKQVLENDSACVWESFEPEETGFGKWGLGRWAKSLCHGWSSGIVPMTTQYVLGVRPVRPGFSAVELRPALDLPWSFDATLPTPYGSIRVRRDNLRKPVRYEVPEAITVAASRGVEVVRKGA